MALKSDVLEAIVLLSCAPYESTLPIACKMYMDTAKMAGYHLVFIQKDYDTTYKRLKIEIAKSIFENDPEDFLDEKGQHWFFCKCRPNKLQDCKGILIFLLFYIMEMCIYVNLRE